MQNILSKIFKDCLEASRNEAQQSGDNSLMADHTFIYIMKTGMSHASHILGKVLKDWEFYQLKTRIEREIAKIVDKRTEDGGKIIGQDANEAFERIISEVSEIRQEIKSQTKQLPQANTLCSGCFLMWIMGRRETITSRVLELYGVTAPKVEEYLRLLPADEDYYSDIEAITKLSRQHLKEYHELICEDEGEDKQQQEDANINDNFGYDSKINNVASVSKLGDKGAMDRYGVNLSKAAQRGDIDPVIGREKEIERAMQILGRRKKNNPILVGEAGVGKSAIVEGLALRIVQGDVPTVLQGKEIFSLDVAALVAGTKFRGEFELRIKNLLDELSANKNMILFIDEVHTIVGTGSSQGGLDTANILKPALARGSLQCIGATTLDEYRETIEVDSALERRFQKIIIEPTTKEQTLRILHNIKTNYEKHHWVEYSDEALNACVELTARYVTDRNFPDKAIDAMDEAGSKAHSFNKHRLSKSIKTQNPTKTVAFNGRAKQPILLGVEHIEDVITSMTGIPTERISQGEKKKLSNMQAHLSRCAIGQADAAQKVTRSILRSRTGLKDPDKPIGVFMFVGPTGVGKTHLAKELSQLIFDRRDALIRIDMSEYSEKHNISRMIGSPPGYVGYSEGGQLTEAVRRQPYAVILFDEIEKAHRDVFNIMLQIFDEGELTDGLGRKIDFRNTIIIMTSNVGSREIADKGGAVGYFTDTMEHNEQYSKDLEYRNSLAKTFAPEFINRIDDIVIFNTLDLEDVQSIVELELDALAQRTKALGYKLSVTPRAKRQLAAMGYDPKYGVRSLKRTILESVETPIAQMIVNEQVAKNDTVRIDHKSGSICVERKTGDKDRKVNKVK